VSFHPYLIGSRKFLGLTALVVALSLASMAGADEPVKKKGATPGYNDPSIGVFGAHRTPEGGSPVNRNAAPPAPSAAPAMPKVEAESPVISGPGTGPAPLPAAPRPDAQAEGVPVGQGAAPTNPHPQQVNSFLAGHPFVSGLIAGLIGTDLGAILYGGTMMGDENAALIGFLGRIGLVILVAVMSVRLIWGLIGGTRKDNDFRAPRSGPRQEPSFGRLDDAGDGRREPSLRAERPSYDNDRSRRRR